MLDGARLAGFGVFSGLTAQQREAIASLCKVDSFEPGEAVLEQDAPATHFYGLLEGEAELVLRVTEKVLKPTIEYEEALLLEHEILERPIVVDVLRTGDVFGWSSLATPAGTLTATVRCCEASTVFSVPGKTLLDLFDGSPELGYHFMRRLVSVISQRLRHRTDKLTEAWIQAFGSHHV